MLGTLSPKTLSYFVVCEDGVGWVAVDTSAEQLYPSTTCLGKEWKTDKDLDFWLLFVKVLMNLNVFTYLYFLFD